MQQASDVIDMGQGWIVWPKRGAHPRPGRKIARLHGTDDDVQPRFSALWWRRGSARAGRAVRIDAARDIELGRRLIDLSQVAQLIERPRAELDAQIDEGEAFLVHDHEAGGLDLLPLAAGRLARLDGAHQPFGQG